MKPVTVRVSRRFRAHEMAERQIEPFSPDTTEIPR